jgi:hypothetical protein
MERERDALDRAIEAEMEQRWRDRVGLEMGERISAWEREERLRRRASWLTVALGASLGMNIYLAIALLLVCGWWRL